MLNSLSKNVIVLAMKRFVQSLKLNKTTMFLSACAAAVIGLIVAVSFAATPSKIKEVQVTELGSIQNPSAPYLLRDGGASGLLGNRLLWTFGDTLFLRKSASGYDGYSSTAGYSELASPTVVSEPLDSKGAPVAPLLPLTPEEENYNKTSGHPNRRYALWPAAVIPESANSALILYDRLKVYPEGDLNYEHLTTGLARITAGSTVAQRINDSLFTGKDNQYLHSHVLHGGYHYLYNCSIRKGTFNSDCSVARTNSILNRNSYSFWNGSNWVADINQAAKVVPGSTSGFSVSYSPYLDSFVSATSTGFSKNIILRTAPSPQGPWSDSVVAFTAPSYVYAVYQHPELSSDNGRTLAISYYRPEDNYKGKLSLIKVRINPSDPIVSGNAKPSASVSGGGSGSMVNGTGPVAYTAQDSTSRSVSSEDSAATNSSSGANSGYDDSSTAAGDDSEQVSSQPKGFFATIWYYISAPLRWLMGLF